MHKMMLILLLLFPMLNFLHEGGHWLGGRLVGANPKMMLQRVDIENEAKFSFMQSSIYNWGGPIVNYSIIVAAVAYTPLAPLGFVMATHRLGPNLFAAILYSQGKTSFTNDETKQFPKSLRLFVALTFSILYLVISILFLHHWVPNFGITSKLTLILGFSITWFGYLVFLDFLDKKIWG